MDSGRQRRQGNPLPDNRANLEALCGWLKQASSADGTYDGRGLSMNRTWPLMRTMEQLPPAPEREWIGFWILAYHWRQLDELRIPFEAPLEPQIGPPDSLVLHFNAYPPKERPWKEFTPVPWFDIRSYHNGPIGLEGIANKLRLRFSYRTAAILELLGYASQEKPNSATFEPSQELEQAIRKYARLGVLRVEDSANAVLGTFWKEAASASQGRPVWRPAPVFIPPVDLAEVEHYRGRFKPGGILDEVS